MSLPQQPNILISYALLRARLIETVDPFVLLPAFGQEGVNPWRDR